MADKEIYFSIDVETDGPIPGPHSMLSLGAAAFDISERRQKPAICAACITQDERVRGCASGLEQRPCARCGRDTAGRLQGFNLDDPLVDTFEVNLETLPGAGADPDTAKFWCARPDAYARTRVHPMLPQAAMRRFVTWVTKTAQLHGGRPVAVCFPATFDFMFVYWYLVRFAGSSPFGFQAFDCKTAAALVMNTSFKEASLDRSLRQFTTGAPLSHISVEDAVAQGYMFAHIMLANKRRADH